MADVHEDETEAGIERWHAGIDAARRGEARPSEKDAGEGWDHWKRESRVRVVMPARPEGHYHAPVGTFD